MLISSSRSRSVAQGFSLIEIVVVLAITAIVFGSAAYMLNTPKDEARIREAHDGIEDLALQARTFSFNYQQPFVMELKEGQIFMRPLANPRTREESEDDQFSGAPTSLKSLTEFNWPRSFIIPAEYELWVKRFGQKDYKLVSERITERWIHQPNSPCEPIEIKLISTDGRSFLSRKYHPLTAKATDLEMAIGNSVVE